MTAATRPDSLDARAVQFAGHAPVAASSMPSMLLWIALIAVLVFLIASPMVRLVVSSLQETETGTPHARQLRRGLWQRAAPAGAVEHRWSSAPASRCSPPVRRAASPGRSRAPTCRRKASSA